MPPRSSHGNTLSEYGLALGLVALVAVTALTFLGKSISFSLGSVPQQQAPMLKLASLDFSGKAPTANGSPSAQGSTSGGLSAASSNPAVANYSMTIDPATGAPVLTVTDSSSGAESNASSIDGSIAKIGMGRTLSAWADGLNSLADKLLQDGSISPDQASLLIELSNKGHSISAAEQVIETAAQNGGAFDPVEFNGTTYPNARALSKTIGLIQQDPNGNWQGGVYMQDFINTLNQVQSSGSLENPGVQAIVYQLSKDIIQTGDMTENTMYDVNHQTLDPQALVETTAAKMTTEKSASICVAGKGTDTQSLCLP